MATIGLDKLYYAKITEDENGNETYATPVQLAKAMNADLSVELAEATLYADDGAAEIVKAVSYTHLDVYKRQVIGQSSLFSRSGGIRRLVHFLIPVGDGVSGYSRITLGDLCLPGMLAIAIHLIAAENGALDGRSAEGDAVTLGRKVRGGDTELHTCLLYTSRCV